MTHYLCQADGNSKYTNKHHYVLEKQLSRNKEDGGCMGGPHFLWYHRENRQSEKKNFNVWQVKFVDSCLKVFSFIHFFPNCAKKVLIA